MEIIKKYFPNLTPKQAAQFEKLNQLYSYWNQYINIISRKDIDHFYEHHVLHSLSIAKLIWFNTGTTILDAGTGGGFPGIPLAIMFPDVYFHLTDSIGKKIKVVNSVITDLELDNVITSHIRVEQINERFDFIVCRAVTKLQILAKWVNNKIKDDSFNKLPNGIIYLKGGDFSQELKSFNNHTLYNIADFFDENFFETKKIIHIPI
ncbi:16S rRNA (guanine(527)-N(7))-methyltransferase RsmG [candidate division KSB1 bacterium]